MSVDWREDLRLKLEGFVDTLVVKGAKQADVYDAIVAEIANLRKAYERDPFAQAPAAALPHALV